MVLTVKIKKKLKNFKLDVDFSAEAGCMGILGASGSGKSMTLKCIAGIETPDEGIIILDNRILFDSEKGINLKPQERRVGYLFQNYALFPNMTVSQNIEIGWKTRHPSANNHDTDEQVSKMIQRFHLSGLEHQYPTSLSGGEQQRTAVARMLLAEPEVLLFDEPFSALDTYLKEELQAEIGKIMQEFGGVSLLVTHNRDEVYKLSDTLFIIERGKGTCHGDTKDLFQNPRNLAVARLTGCKNISPIEVKSNHVILATKWSLPIQIPDDPNRSEQSLIESRNASHKSNFPQKIDKGRMYIGVRAHDFHIYKRYTQESAQAGENSFMAVEKPENTFAVRIREITEAPFEWNVMFTIAGEPEDADRLWWKVSKEIVQTRKEIEQVEMLMIKKGGVLLLDE